MAIHQMQPNRFRKEERMGMIDLGSATWFKDSFHSFSQAFNFYLRRFMGLNPLSLNVLLFLIDLFQNLLFKPRDVKTT